MRKIIFATGNEGKLKEVRELLKDLNFEVLSLKEAGLQTDIKNQYILDKLKNVPTEKRGARFVCVIACVLPDGQTRTERAVIEGQIAENIAGTNGFGYDPIFYVPEFSCTTAELTMEQKNKISHRAKALNQIKPFLQELEKSWNRKY